MYVHTAGQIKKFRSFVGAGVSLNLHELSSIHVNQNRQRRRELLRTTRGFYYWIASSTHAGLSNETKRYSGPTIIIFLRWYTRLVVISFTEKERKREREEEKGHDITLEGEEDDLPGPGRNENVQRFEKVSGKGGEGTNSSDVENDSPISSHSRAGQSGGTGRCFLTSNFQFIAGRRSSPRHRPRATSLEIFNVVTAAFETRFRPPPPVLRQFRPV